jgi:antirestriction protein ArdC
LARGYSARSALCLSGARRIHAPKEGNMASERKDEIVAKLTAGIEQLASSERWQNWLAVQSRFHHYSFRNALLIQLQCPHATRVAGFHAWRQLGRCVRKGEKAIWILAPVSYKRERVEEHRRDDDDDDARVIVAFKPACVFDVSQTDGEPLPQVCTHLEGSAPDGVYEQLMEVADSIGYTVEDFDFDDSRNGDCAFEMRRIRVRRGNGAAQRVKTLVHELAHAMLHANAEDRSLAELEAESVAFVVCEAIGIASDDYSFGYVTTWAGGSREAVTAIKASASRIQFTADRILQTLTVSEAAAAAAA